MWVKPCSRELLIDIVASDGRKGSQDAARLPRGPKRPRFKELLLGWGDDPAKHPQLPHVIFVRDGRIQDFLAWSSTYLRTVRPFSAFCRVLEWGVWNLEVLSQSPRLDNEKVAIGAVLGEAVTHQHFEEAASLTTRACMSTFSFALAREWALGRTKQLDTIADAWSRTRNITKQPKRALSAELICQAWSCYLGDEPAKTGTASLYERSWCSDVRQVCEELSRTGDMSQPIWDEITSGLSHAGRLRRSMRESREQRVMGLESALAELSHADDPKRASFLAGLLCSRVSPGTLEHSHLLRPSVGALPLALIWYGICAGLHPQSRVLDFQQGLGRRVLRELMAVDDLGSRPRCDISVAELDVFLTGDVQDVGFSTMSSGHLMVEIAPGTLSTVGWPINHSQPSAITAEKRQTDTLLELGDTLRKATELYRRALRDLRR